MMNGYRIPAMGVLLGSALIAGIITYIVSSRPARREQPLTEKVMGRAKEIDRAEVARLGREFVSEKVVPEMKPVLVEMVRDIRNYIDRYFDQAEKTIKAM